MPEDKDKGTAKGGVARVPEVVRKARRASLAKLNARFGASSETSDGGGTSYGADDDNEKKQCGDPLLLKLDSQWAEVEFVLRVRLETEADVEKVRASIADSIWFLDELSRLASKYGYSRGALSRMILPYHTNTSVSSQKAEVFSADASPLGEMLDHSIIVRLAGAANALRGLVRVKVADDADLDAARRAVELVSSFLDGAAEYMARESINIEECFRVLSVR